MTNAADIDCNLRPVFPVECPVGHVPPEVECVFIACLKDCDISDCNSHFQGLVVRRILETGKHVDDITVGEMRRLVYAARHDFNRPNA